MKSKLCWLTMSLVLLPVLVTGCGKDYKVQGNTVTVRTADARVRIQVMGEKVFRVSVTPERKFNDRKSLAVLPQAAYKSFAVTRDDEGVRIATQALSAVVRPDGTVWFYDAEGNMLAGDGRAAFAPIEVEGKKAWSTTVSYASDPGESFYGLGQHQAGEFDHKGRNEELYQYNTKVSVPMVVSTRG